MPNYSFVTTSRFKPYSFKELLEPFALYREDYREQQDALADLDTKASIWDGMANEQTDPVAHAQYKKYADDLRAQADILATEGLNPSSRQAMLNLRNRYAKEIIPIEQAFKRRNQLAEEQRKAGNSMIYDIDAATTSLDKFLTNPELQYRSIDRKDLLNRSMAEFGSLAKSLEAYGKGQPIDDYTNTFVQQHGITRKAASDFIESVRNGNVSSADPTLKAIYNNLYNSTRVSEWNSPTAQEAVKNTILEGVVAGIGQTNVSTFQDVAKIKALEHSYAMKRMEKQAELNAQKAKEANEEGNIPTLVPLRSTQELSDTNKKIEKYKKYFKQNPDGSWEMTKEGFDAMFTKSYGPAPGTKRIDGTIISAPTVPNLTEFGKFMQDLNGGKPLLMADIRHVANNPESDIITSGRAIAGTGPKYRGNLFAKYMNANTEGSYDIYRSTEGIIRIESSQRDDVTDAFFEDAGTGKKGAKVLQAVDFNGKDGWKNTKAYTVTELSDAGYKVTSVRPSVYGMTAYLQAKGKEPLRVIVPKGVNIANIDASQYNMSEATKLNRLAQSEYLPAADEDNNIIYDDEGNVVFTNSPMTDAARIYFSNQARQALIATGSNAGSLVRPSKAETIKY